MTPTIVAISKDYFSKKDRGELPEYKTGDAKFKVKQKKASGINLRKIKLLYSHCVFHNVFFKRAGFVGQCQANIPQNT